MISVYSYLQKTKPSLELFKSILVQYQMSSLYNTETQFNDSSQTTFVLLGIFPKSDVNFVNSSGSLVIRLKADKKLEADRSLYIDIINPAVGGNTLFTKINIALSGSNLIFFLIT